MCVCVITAFAVPGSDMCHVDAGSDRTGHVVTPICLDSSHTFPRTCVVARVCVCVFFHLLTVLNLHLKRSRLDGEGLCQSRLSQWHSCITAAVKTLFYCLCVVVVLNFIHISPRKPLDMQA